MIVLVQKNALARPTAVFVVQKSQRKAKMGDIAIGVIAVVFIVIASALLFVGITICIALYRYLQRRLHE